MALPDWLEPLYDSAGQRGLDQWAIDELGIPGVELMERAGTGLAELVMEIAPTGRITVVCGKGNNGGDGLVCARYLRERGREVEVMLLGEPDQLQGDVAANLERLPGAAPAAFDPGRLVGSSAIVDAILGTGFHGEPREPAAGAIRAINQLADRSAVVGCDVPSGVDASTGEVAGCAVRARATATFHAGKAGLWIAPGKDHAGEIRVVDIGIPPGGPSQASIGLIGSAVATSIPRRGRESTKFAAGSVLVCGGSTGLTGAPCLASDAAMRAGAGYVTALVPASLNPIFESQLLEVMTVPLADTAGSLSASARDVVLERTDRAGALILGPGLGRAGEAPDLARQLAEAARIPLVLDADGLNAHAGELETLASREAPTVLTPHAGELARLLGLDSREVSARRLGCAREAAARSRAVVVLKGDDTIVTQPEGPVAVSRGGASALATAGTGDVLSGVIGAYLAKGMDPFTAAAAGVLVHARAGQMCAERIGAEGVIARDVIAALPAALGAAVAE